MRSLHLQGILVVTLLVACAAQEREPGAEPGAVNQAQGSPDQEPNMSPRVRGPATLLPSISGFEVSPIEATQGEDGHGQLVAATQPVALDVRADAWPGRALDPVLYVGQDLVFRRYSHPGPGLLRFVAADGSSLPAGAQVFLGFGDDPSSRVLVTGSLGSDGAAR